MSCKSGPPLSCEAKPQSVMHPFNATRDWPFSHHSETAPIACSKSSFACFAGSFLGQMAESEIKELKALVRRLQTDLKELQGYGLHRSDVMLNYKLQALHT